MVMLETDLAALPGLHVSVHWDPAKFPGLKWKTDIPGQFDEHGKQRAVTFAVFTRGRGVATGLKHQSDIDHCNRLLLSLPSFERGHEHREMTDKERGRERAIQFNKEKTTAAKRKRQAASSASSSNKKQQRLS